MKFDHDETYLHEKLTDDLHPAAVDLWPAVAEALPDARGTRHPRWKLAICFAAPLLIAAGVLAGTAEFTNLRENPRPSFAPEANTGYAITYERQYFTLEGDLLAGMVANHNGETADDGWKPMNASTRGLLHLSDADARNLYSGAARGYDRWEELTAATGLPLVQNALLDAGETDSGSAVALYPTGMIEIPADGRLYVPRASEYPVGCIPVGDDETPEKLYLRVGKKVGGYNVELMAVAYLGSAPKQTATVVFEQKSAGLTWDCESYTMANGNTALIPHCTSNPTSMPWTQSVAYFAQDGILYKVICAPQGGWFNAAREEVGAGGKAILDAFRGGGFWGKGGAAFPRAPAEGSRPLPTKQTKKGRRRTTCIKKERRAFALRKISSLFFFSLNSRLISLPAARTPLSA